MLALDRIMQSDEYVVDHLHTVIDKDLRRVGLHGIHERLVDAQAASLGIPLEKLYLDASHDHLAYEQLMAGYFQNLLSEEFDAVMYGDIYLEDLKAYREKMLLEAELEGVYPIWNEKPASLISEFIERGHKTMICAADAKYFDKNDLGQTLTHKFIENLPDQVDVCGENGEFHTFVYDSPLFHFPLDTEKGEIVEKSYTYNKKNEDGSVEALKSSFFFVEMRMSN